MSSVTIEAGSGPGNDADLINALLADPTVTEVVLGEGVFLIDKPIVVPSGKTLTGAGRDSTMIRAEADFVAVPGANGLVMSEMGATGVTLSDFSLDAAKLLPDGVRVNGTFMRQATDFTVERVDVYNTTGYGQFAQGDVNHLSVFASGEYTDCGTFNCQIGFEQMTCDGIVLLNCHARDGDGDLVGTYFHPLTGSKNIFFIDCTGYGKGYAGFDLISNKEIPLENIVIINSSIELLAGGSAIVTSGAYPVVGLHLEGSSFVSHLGLGALLSGVTGTAVNSVFQGFAIGLEIVDSVFDVTDSRALGLRDPATGASAYGVAVHASAILGWDGGTIEARAAPGLMYPISGQVDYTERTALVSSGYDVLTRYEENEPAIRVALDLSLALDGLGDLAGGSLTVAYQAHPTPDDQLLLLAGGSGPREIGIAGNYVTYVGVAIGQVFGGANGSPLVVSFGPSASAEAVQALVAAIAYTNSSDDPSTLSRALRFTVTDGTGLSAEASVAIVIGAIDDMPVIELAGTAAHIAGGAAVALAPDAILTELDAAGYTGVTLSVGIAGGATLGDRLLVLSQGGNPSGIEVVGDLVTYGGAAIGTLTGGEGGDPLIVRFNAAASLDAVQALVRAIAFDNPSTTRGTGARELVFTFDGEGSRSTAVSTLLVAPADTVWQGDGGDSAFIGDPGHDLFLLSDGGDDSASGGEGDDSFDFGSSLTANDRIDGGAGFDTVFLQGSYDLTLSPSWLTGIDQLWLLSAAGRATSYRLASSGGLAAPGSWFTVNAAGLKPGDALEFSAAAEISAQFRILGGGGDDRLTGGDLGDEIRGGDGADRLTGLGGDDLLNGGSGNDVIMAGIGNDMAFGGDGADQILAGAGDDRLYGEADNDTLIGEEGDDYLEGGLGDDRLYGGADHDYLRGSHGSDALHGEDGDDQLLGDDGDDKLYGGAGADSLYGGAGADHMLGGTDDDILFGEDGDDQLLGEDGDDKVYAGAGLDTLYGGAGADHLRGGAENDILFGEDGDDQLLGEDGDDKLYGGAGADTLYGGAGADHLRGGAESDILFGEDGDDQLLGDDGDDKLSGGAGFDSLYGGAGADYLRGGTEMDILFGEDGDDQLLGDEGDDKLIGGAGVDILYGGAGVDHLRGGTEGDLLFGEDGDDQLLGDDGDDKLSGGVGVDYLYGGGGADYLQGGTENDILFGEGGDDRLLGDDGDDSLYGGAGADQLYGGAGADHLRGGAEGDVLFGEEGDDQLLGEEGNDKLIGGLGADALYGGAGADHLEGGTGNDMLFGEVGDDRISGGGGADRVDGGFGADRFLYHDVADSRALDTDLILNFETGLDRIDLSAIDASAVTEGNDTFTFIGSTAFSGTAGELRTISDGTNWAIEADIDGDGAADLVILATLPNEAQLTSGDFIL